MLLSGVRYQEAKGGPRSGGADRGHAVRSGILPPSICRRRWPISHVLWWVGRLTDDLCLRLAVVPDRDGCPLMSHMEWGSPHPDEVPPRGLEKVAQDLARPWIATRWWWLPAVASVVVGCGLSFLLVVLSLEAIGSDWSRSIKWLLLLPAGVGVAGAGGVIHWRRAVRFPTSLGIGRFASDVRGYSAAEVDAFWSNIDERTADELRDVGFSMSEPGYDCRAVEKALALRLNGPETANDRPPQRRSR